jgi:hypothetical protein
VLALDCCCGMAAPKIKKKSSDSKAKTSAMPRQGAIPCLILLIIALVIAGFFFFASLRTAG